jgi:exosortase A
MTSATAPVRRCADSNPPEKCTMPDNDTATTVRPPSVAVIGTRSPGRGLGTVATVVLLLAWVLALYFPTTLSMVAIWESSETFAHGFVVFPIFLYLLWRERDALATIETARCLPALLGIAGAGAVWYLGERISAVVVSQLAMVAMVPFAVWAVLGTRVVAALVIPLLFLFFAVPFGDFLVPTLMDRTADFTVAAIQASGVPIYREGNYFQIPSGRWSIVEACSGFRYLIASFMVGSLYAYLSYRSPMRRATFIVASLIVPIIANWLRAYMIVMLGHLSNNRIAVGADHLIYGWIFFGIVMALLFWIGSRWREDDAPVRAPSVVSQARHTPPMHAHQWPMLIAVFALTALWPVLGISLDQAAKGRNVELGRIGDGSGWIAAPDEISGWRPDLSGATAETRQTFAKGGRQVALHIAIYRDQTREAKAITSTNQLVRTGNPLWQQVGADSISQAIDGQAFTARTAVIANPRQRLVAWQWFWVDGHETSSEFLAKLYQALSVLRGHGDPVAWVVVYMPAGAGGVDTTATLRDFSAGMRASIDTALRRAVAQ